MAFQHCFGRAFQIIMQTVMAPDRWRFTAAEGWTWSYTHWSSKQFNKQQPQDASRSRILWASLLTLQLLSTLCLLLAVRRPRYCLMGLNTPSWPTEVGCQFTVTQGWVDYPFHNPIRECQPLSALPLLTLLFTVLTDDLLSDLQALLLYPFRSHWALLHVLLLLLYTVWL